MSASPSLARLLLVLLLVAAVLLGGCVQLNRDAYEFNRCFTQGLLVPVHDFYVLILPAFVRERISSFFANLRYGDVVVNQLLQGKPCLAFQDLRRWFLNSTVGIAGLFDVAAEMGFPAHDEDFGQTLAVWGLPQGPFLVLPILGPTTPRDLVGRGISIASSPTFWVDVPLIDSELTILSYVVQGVEARGALARVEEEAADPYVFLREAYLQHREYLIHDGHVKPKAVEGLEDLDGLDGEDDGGPAAPPPGVGGLPGLDDLTGAAAPTSPDELPGLDAVEGAGGPASPADLPGLDDLQGAADGGADDLPGLDG